jgi:hypothetical protein
MDINRLLTVIWPRARVSNVFNGINSATVSKQAETYIAAVYNGSNDAEITETTEPYIAHVFNGYNDEVIA